MIDRLRPYLDRRVALMLALGFSCGLPFLLVGGTFTARLATAQIDIKAIGLFAYLLLPYSFKFLWAPVVDAVDLPVLSRLLGRRRAWMVSAQGMVALALLAMSATDPVGSLPALGAAAFLAAFAAATQDIVVDAWRIESVDTDRQGMMLAAYQLGYRLGLISAGAGALVLAGSAGWQASYLAMAALMAVGLAGSLLAPAPDRGPTGGPVGSRPHAEVVRAADPRSTHDHGASFEARLRLAPQDEDRQSGQPTSKTKREPFDFGKAVKAPLADLYRRQGPRLVAVLALVAFYRLPDFVSGVMANPFYIGMGYSLPEIAAVSKLYGIWVGMLGAFAGGWAIVRFGLFPVLVAGAVAGAASNLAFSWLAGGPPELWRLTVAISVDNFSGTFAGTALMAYMSSLTGIGFAATQYALLSSLYALPGKLVSGVSGFAVAAWGFPAFFAATAAVGVPVVILCLLVGRTPEPSRSDEAEAGGVAAPRPA